MTETAQEQQDVSFYDFCAFCDYGPLGFNKCPQPYM